MTLKIGIVGASFAKAAYLPALKACLCELNGKLLNTTLTSLGYFFKTWSTKLVDLAQNGH